jgi:hypothetical protein
MQQKYLIILITSVVYAIINIYQCNIHFIYFYMNRSQMHYLKFGLAFFIFKYI